MSEHLSFSRPQRRARTLLRRGFGVCALSVCATAAVRPRADATALATLRGRVTADSLSSPVRDAEVVFIERSARVRTDSLGQFVFRDVAPGVIHLRVTHPNFDSWSDSLVISSDTITLHIQLTKKAQMLSEVRVETAAERLSSPLLADFRRRRAGYGGKFLAAEDIEKLRAQSFVSLVRGHVGGFDLVRHPSGVGTAFASRRAGGTSIDNRIHKGPNECYSNIWVNGQLMYYVTPSPKDPPRLEDFDIRSITAVEFYRGAAETPIELNTLSAACGTVAIWMYLK